MPALLDLWLPILVSAIGIFVVSSLVHMVLTHHHHDFKKLPQEDAIREALQPLQPPPGDYMVPWACDMKDRETEAYQQKLAEGPVAMFTVYPRGPFTMGSSLGLWFLYLIVGSLFVAYITRMSTPVGAGFKEVLQPAGTAAFLAFAFSHAQASIWMKRSWGTTFRNYFDGLLYALTSGAIFAWLWPGI